MSDIIEQKDNGISIPQAIGIVLVVAVLLFITGYFVGEKFFWDQYDSTSVYQQQTVALENFTRQNPKNRNAKVVLFDKYFGLGKFTEARKILTDLKRDLSKNPDIIYRDALLLKQEGESKKALAEIEKVVKAKPFFTSARVAYAQILSENKQYDKALEELTMVLKIMPAAADLYLEKGKIYLAKGDKKKAMEAVNFALKMVPDYKEALEFKKQIN